MSQCGCFDGFVDAHRWRWCSAPPVPRPQDPLSNGIRQYFANFKSTVRLVTNDDCSNITVFRLARFNICNYNPVASEAIRMTRVERLAEQLMACPRTFRFDDAVRVMAWYGFALDEKGRTSGSRIRFYREHDGRMLIMHAPHPGNELRAAAVRNMVMFLREAGRR